MCIYIICIKKLATSTNFSELKAEEILKQLSINSTDM